jgi:hypothetical protein
MKDRGDAWEAKTGEAAKTMAAAAAARSRFFMILSVSRPGNVLSAY